MKSAYEPLSPEEVRRHKGKSFPGIAVTFLCHDGTGRFFMTKRSTNSRDEPGTWDVGGGGLRFGETLAEGVRREVHEEYGATPLADPQLLGFREVFRTAPDGVPTHWLAFDFAVRIDPAVVHINEPDMLSDSGWFTLGTLPSPRHSQMETIYWEQHQIALQPILGAKK